MAPNRVASRPPPEQPRHSVDRTNPEMSLDSAEPDQFVFESNPASYRDEHTVTRDGSVYTYSQGGDWGDAPDEATVGGSTIGSYDPAGGLYYICEAALPKPGDPERPTKEAADRRREQLERTWEEVGNWLSAHPSPDERRAAAEYMGNYSSRPLHLVCKLPDPPAGIVKAIIDCSPVVASLNDEHGMLPLHYASVRGASCEILSMLCDAYPEGKLVQDLRRRTPLHFAFIWLFHVVESPEGDRDETDETDSDGSDGGGVATGNSMEDTVLLLSDTGAARIPDEKGMLPMHYACAYGTDASVLTVLERAFPESVGAREAFGRTPLHLAMVNCHRTANPAVLCFLLSLESNRDIVNIPDNEGHLPHYLLAVAAKTERFSPDQAKARNNACKCLSLYLDSKPNPSAEFLSALQTLPGWLRDTAVLNVHVQNVLNAKSVSHFPTFITFADFYVLIMVIVCFSFSTIWFIQFRSKKANKNIPLPGNLSVSLSLVITGGIWFLIREITQVASMVNLGAFRSWLFDPRNLHDVIVICLVLYHGGVMYTNPDWVGVWGNDNNPNLAVQTSFRVFSGITQLVLYVALIIFLRGVSVEFAVFAGGLFYVMRRTLAFFVIPLFFLLMFADMFYIAFTGSELCTRVDGTSTYQVPHEENSCYEDFPHCDFGPSLLKSYSMMLGEIGDECRYQIVTNDPDLNASLNWDWASATSQVIYILYALIVVIILSTMLIAIATDSYDVIKNERAAMVFWSNRLDFVAEMDAVTKFFRTVANNVLGKTESRGAPGTARASGAPRAVQEVPGGVAVATNGPDGGGGSGDLADSAGAAESGGDGGPRKVWDFLVSLFAPSQPGVEEPQRCCSMDYWFYQVVRVWALGIIPLWLLVGFLTFGVLLPPQVRQFIFVQKHTSMSAADVAEQVHQDIKQLKKGMKTMRLNFQRETKYDQKEMLGVKAEVETLQRDVLSDLSQLKENLAMLSELVMEKVREREERSAIAAARRD